MCRGRRKKRAVKIKLMNGKQHSSTWIGIETRLHYDRGKITAPWAVSLWQTGGDGYMQKLDI